MRKQMMLLLKNMFLLTIGMMLLVLYFVWASQGTEVARRFAQQENAFMCHISFEDSRGKQSTGLPKIYFVTPTYPRREQAAELTRLGQTLMHVPDIHWIVADDNRSCNAMVAKLLKKFGIPFTHIASPMPEVYRKASIVPRGVANRRAAINWIRKNTKQGVIYFGDDDNTFDLKLFEEIRDTKKVSMFPVGLIGDYAVSSPVLKEGKVVGFFDSWPSKRKFPVDMAGFAVNVEFLLNHPNATMPYKAGYEEDQFLRSLGLALEDIEPKADSCTQVLVWHTQTSKKASPTIRIQSELDTSLKDLLKEITVLGMGHVSSSSGGTAVALSVVCLPFVLPAVHRICLPYVPATATQIKNVMCALTGRSGRLVDLGSGDGRIVLTAAKAGFIADGVELNPWLVAYSKLQASRLGLSSCVRFYCQDLWKFHLQPYTNIVIFGTQEMMPELEVKLRKELHNGAHVVACRFPFPTWTPDATLGTGLDTVWLYKTPPRMKINSVEHTEK